jgi:ribose transport system substrate-binding protein
VNRRNFILGAPALLASCGGRKKLRIAVIPKSTAHLFWVSVHAGALAAAKKYGAEILWNGPPSESDYSRQVQIVDSMIVQKVDGIAIAAAERKALAGAVERAAAAGIPVVVFDSGLDSQSYLSFVSTDNYEGGKLGARKLAELTGGKGDVAVILHAPGSFSTMDRERGFRDALAAEFPGMRIVAEQFGMGDRAKARASAENILAANASLAGLFASTEPASAGISLALKARGQNGKIKFVGFDSSDAMIDDLKDGTLNATVVQDAFRLGYDPVRILAENKQGVTPPKQVDLPARVVTAADLSKPEVLELLKPDVKKYL